MNVSTVIIGLALVAFKADTGFSCSFTKGVILCGVFLFGCFLFSFSGRDLCVHACAAQNQPAHCFFRKQPSEMLNA